MRIRGDSLRLRLTRGEVARLVSDGHVEDAVRFGPTGTLTYRIEAGDAATPATAALDLGPGAASVRVLLPHAEMRHWASSDTEVSIEAEQPLGDGGQLRILVEKDFACLVPRGGEDDDTFPHPEA